MKIVLGYVGTSALLAFAVACSSDDGGAGPPPPPLNVPGNANASGGDVTQESTGTLQTEEGGAQGVAGAANTAPEPETPGGDSAGTAGTPTPDPNGNTGAPMAPGAGGSAGMVTGGNENIPLGTGLAITPGNDGWVSGASNGLSIQGAFYVASDAADGAGNDTGTGSTIVMDAATTPGSICVSGTLAAIASDGDPVAPTFLFGDYWGGVVGLNLSQVLPPGGAEAMPGGPWSRSTAEGEVTGFNYTLTANNGTELPHMRFGATFSGQMPGSTYCQDGIHLLGSGTPLGLIVERCWEGPLGTAIPASDLFEIQWAIIPNTEAPTPFDFCISNVTATTG